MEELLGLTKEVIQKNFEICEDMSKDFEVSINSSYSHYYLILTYFNSSLSNLK